MEFVKGKWYKSNPGDYFAKCTKFENNIMYAHQFYLGRYQDYGALNYNFMDIYTWAEATQEEINEFLPENHPDAYPDKKSVSEPEAEFPVMTSYPEGNYFKAVVVKDIIRSEIKCAGTLPYIIPKGYKTWFKPKDTTCRKRITNKSSDVVFPESNRWSANIPAYYFEIVEDEAPKQEKVNPNTDFIFEPGGYYVGNWGDGDVIFKTSTDSLKDGCYLIDTDGNYRSPIAGCRVGSGITFRKATEEEKQRLIKEMKVHGDLIEESTESSSKFKIGDKVKAISQSFSWGYVKLGDIGVVSSIRSLGYGVDFDNQKGWKAKESDLELVSEEREDLLAEAYRRYPPGTVYKCAGNVLGKYTVKSDTTFRYYSSDNTQIDAHGLGFVYYKGKWAEIVEAEKESKVVKDKPSVQDIINTVDKDALLEEARRRYPIGTKVKCLSNGEVETIVSDFEWDNSKTQIKQEDSPSTRVYRDSFWSNSGWAEIIELPKSIEYEECPQCEGSGQTMVAKLYPSGHTEVNETCDMCDGGGEIECTIGAEKDSLSSKSLNPSIEEEYYSNPFNQEFVLTKPVKEKSSKTITFDVIEI